MDRSTGFITRICIWSAVAVLVCVGMVVMLSLLKSGHKHPAEVSAEENVPDEPVAAELPFPPSLSDDLPYDKVVWLCAHNAMSNAQDHWACPNQNINIAAQLNAGIHAQMWDIHDVNGIPTLQHGNGSIALPGSLTLEKGLLIVKDYLDAHPEAVVTLIFESYVPNDVVRRQIQATGCVAYTLDLTPGAPFPTLGEMRRTNKRLLIFTDRPDDVPQAPMPVWSYACDTPWDISRPHRLPAEIKRGQADAPLFIANHFVTRLLPVPSDASAMNSRASLQTHLELIRKRVGRTPNFWVLDFADVGDGQAFVRDQNSH